MNLGTGLIRFRTSSTGLHRTIMFVLLRETGLIRFRQDYAHHYTGDIAKPFNVRSSGIRKSALFRRMVPSNVRVKGTLRAEGALLLRRFVHKVSFRSLISLPKYVHKLSSVCF